MPQVPTAPDSQNLRDGASHNRDIELEALLARHASWVFATAFRQLGDPHLAEDATQTVFLLLFKRPHIMRSHPKLSGWLFNTLHYAVRDIRRSARRRAFHEHRAALQKSPDSSAIRREDELAGQIDAAVHRLRAPDRDVILLRFYQDLSFDQIAQSLDLTEAAARKRVGRAVDRLRKHLASPTDSAALTAAASIGLAEVPARLVQSIARNVLSAKAGALPAAAAAAMKRTAMMSMAKTKALIAGAVAAFLLTTAGTVAYRRMAGGGLVSGAAPATRQSATGGVVTEAPAVPVVTLGPADNPIRQVVFSPEALVALSSELRFYSLPTPQRRPELLSVIAASKDGSEQIVSAAFAPRDSKGAVGAWAISRRNNVNEMRIFGLPGGKEKVIPTGPMPVILAFSPDGKSLASAGSEKTGIKIWDAATGNERLTLEHAIASSIAFSPDSKTLAAEQLRDNGDDVKIWDVASGKWLRSFPLRNFHPAGPALLAFSPDGKTLASSAFQDEVKLWDPATHAERATLAAEWREGLLIEQFGAIAFSPDGKTLATAVQPTTDNPDHGHHVVVLWDVATGRRLMTLKGHSRYINSVAFSPDGKVLASGSDDKTVKVWYLGGPPPPPKQTIQEPPAASPNPP